MKWKLVRYSFASILAIFYFGVGVYFFCIGKMPRMETSHHFSSEKKKDYLYGSDAKACSIFMMITGGCFILVSVISIVNTVNGREIGTKSNYW